MHYSFRERMLIFTSLANISDQFIHRSCHRERRHLDGVWLVWFHSRYSLFNMAGHPIKRVAVIGLGPAGGIAIDALYAEKTFDVIRVFERREGPGGCWLVPVNSPREE